MLVDIRLTLAYLAEQPIIHTEETLGNISKIKKMRVMVGGKPVPVPALSGNSFRGQLRDVLADRMFEVLSNNGQQHITFNNNEIYGAVYSGGALREESRLAGTMHTLKDAVPMIRLMGAAFGNVMLPSKLAVTHIVPCAEETRSILASALSELGDGILSPVAEWPKAHDLIFNDGPLTRKDDRRDPARQRFVDLGPVPEDEHAQHQQMIYYVECIPSGTWLLHQLYSKYSLDELELGCLFDGLTTWLGAPTLGGRSAAGYGQVRAHVRGKVGDEAIRWPEHPEWPEAIKQALSKYRAYLDQKRADLLTALQAEAKEGQDDQVEGDA
jgi:hypothetical protein